jgi:transcriptional regulator with GAF, ATPase, and Fis domain
MLNEPFAVALSNYLRHREVIEFKDRLVDDNQYFQYELRRAGGGEIVGAEFGLKGVMDVIRQAAPLESPILLLGETGVGKEVIANAIHDLSPRRNGPFIKVNCGAIPPTIMDSELFGHEKGAFTGAISQKRGRFERAHGGTIFLDEIGELPLEAQVRLLRVLQEKEFDRVGGAKPVQVDIRVIAATHRNLEAMLDEGTFRQDLYYRLRVVPLVIPPLRERTIDIPLLVHFFIQKKTREMGLEAIPAVRQGEIDRLMQYSWPGNVRELENAVERALILNRSGDLTFKGLADTSIPSRPLPAQQEPISPDQALRLDDVIAGHIAKVLQMTRGTVHGPNGAARLLDLNPSTLRQKMRKLGIPFGREIKQAYTRK